MPSIWGDCAEFSHGQLHWYRRLRIGLAVTAFPNQLTKKVKPLSQVVNERRARLSRDILRHFSRSKLWPPRQVSYQPDSAEPVNKHWGGRPRQQWSGQTTSFTIGQATQTMMGTLFNTISFYGQRESRMRPCQAPKHSFDLQLSPTECLAWQEKMQVMQIMM